MFYSADDKPALQANKSSYDTQESRVVVMLSIQTTVPCEVIRDGQ